MSEANMAKTFKKGDLVVITFRNGVDSKGKDILVTLERSEVLNDCEEDHLKVSFRNLESPAQVELDELTFDLQSAPGIRKQCD
jgi:hypothetical protein